MNFLRDFPRKGAKKMSSLFKFSRKPKFRNPSLIVGWEDDVGELSPKVIDYLNRKIEGKSFCQINPVDFFPLAGVTIEDDVAQFPESRFYYSPKNNLVILKSSKPQFASYQFLNAILDVAEHHCKVKELFTIEGALSPIAHTNPRRILAIFNHSVVKRELRDYKLTNMPQGQRPTTNCYLLWIANRRDIPGVNLCPEIPFYLGADHDPRAVKRTLLFLNKRFKLDLDLSELDEEIQQQDLVVAQLREEDSEINKSIELLEVGISLSGEEQMELTERVTKLLEKRG